MSRRDTVIIAVLLNAGLLIVLFATSLKSDKVVEEPSAITVLASNQTEAKEMVSPVVAPAVSDPVDFVIEQYVTPQVVTQGVGSEVHPQEVVTPELSTAEISYKEVTVKKGDVLERIARQNHVSVSEIMKVNKLTSTRLRIGQVLKIPAAGTVASAAPTGTSQYYTVKAGDNPWTIAVKHHMKVEELLKLNNMDEQKARRLKAGDKIRIN